MEQKAESKIQDLITKDMTIGEVVDKYPAVIEPLQEAGVHCVGCHVSYDETLEQGFKGHGMADEEVDAVLERLNKAVIEGRATEGKDFIITKNASEKLAEVLKENKQEGSALRVGVIPGGCSGFKYTLELDNNITNEDKVFEQDGVKVVIGTDYLPMLKGAKLDYSDGLTGAGFKISNPNAHGTCGCGESFH